MREISPELGLEKPREACGVAAVFAYDRTAPVGAIAHGLVEGLQHRGQSAAGILVTGRQTNMLARMGLVKEVFPDGAKQLDDQAPDANISLGHTMYGSSSEGLMPYLGFAHNGHIANYEQVADTYGISEEDRASDSITIANILNSIRASNGGSLRSAMHELLPQLEGGYAIVATDGTRVIGARDPNGLKPLVLGGAYNSAGKAKMHTLASEDKALVNNDLHVIRDIRPGELIIIDGDSIVSEQIDREVDKKLCMFEAVYFMNEKSTFEGTSVRDHRYKMGRILAEKHPVENADVVIGVPDSSLPSAQGYADQIGKPCELGLVKNPAYKNGRTFIQNSQEAREQAVREKFIVDEEYVRDKVIVLQDDSIVRSTTMRALVGMLREAGAAEIHIRINSPPIKWPCFYGVDMGHREGELIASVMYPREMAAALDADSIAFLSEEEMAESMSIDIGRLCLGCTSGDYPTAVPLPESTRTQAPRSTCVPRIA